MFDTVPIDLKDLMQSINDGRLQLPDFQRDWVWGDSDIRSLLASIGRGFPVGALLTLQQGGDINFKPRVLAGAPYTNNQPHEFLLDGQQRLTSLFQATVSQDPVVTKNPKGQGVKRFYYLDIKKSLNNYQEFEDAIVGVPEDRILRSNFGRNIALDLSSQELEYENHMFPLNRLFAGPDWIFEWRRYWEYKNESVTDLAMDFHQHIYDKFTRYKMPVIRLDQSNSREAVCVIFEKVNVGGKKLDAFELLTAIYAADRFDLRHDWLGDPDGRTPGRRERILGIQNPRPVFNGISSIEFLQACTVLYTRKRRQEARDSGRDGRDLPPISCGRSSLLQLPVEEYQYYADAVESGFVEASRFLNNQKIYWEEDLPYPPQFVVLAAIYAVLGRDAQTAASSDKLERWFWCGVLGEVFGSASESKIARDVPELIDWICGSGPEPETVQSAYLQIDRLDRLKSRQSAAYKGMHALLMKAGSRDFITGNEADIMTVYQDRIDIHHIFPKKWCVSEGIDPDIYNSIINKTALSATSNRTIGGDAPSRYLERIADEKGLSESQIDSILETHGIDPQTMRDDAFFSFLNKRRDYLIRLAADAMGKQPITDSEEGEPIIDLPEEVMDEGS